MSKYYDGAIIPAEMRRNFDVYDRTTSLGVSLGSFEEDVVSLANANIAGAVIHESGLVYLSGTTGGQLPMSDDPERISHGQDGAQQVADVLAAKGIDVDRRKISLDEEIRLTGIYPAKVKLHPEHTAEIKITVEPDMARAPVATPVAEQEPATQEEPAAQEETTTQEEPAEQEETTAQEEPTA